MCCLMASMFPNKAASPIEMSGALTVGGLCFVSVVLEPVNISGAGTEYCDSPHPTSNTAAIVVSSINSTSRKLSSLHAWYSSRFDLGREA